MGKAKKGTDKIDIEEEKEVIQEKLSELLSENASETEITQFMKNFGIERYQGIKLISPSCDCNFLITDEYNNM